MIAVKPSSMVRAHAKHVFWTAVLCVLTVPARGQRTTQSTAGTSQNRPAVEPSAQPVSTITSSHLVSPDEGRVITRVALKSRKSSRPRGDCSHVVHAIYQQAGFPYRYADSTELYDGTENFRRVSHPQAGDLAVWRGHAAIMVNPAQHTFFGATRSGLRVESYDLKYWQHRGTPRFFRYVKLRTAQLR